MSGVAAALRCGSPDLCHDAHDAACADGGPGGLPAADAFHYGLLRSLEDLFGLSHLGCAGASGLRALGDDVFPRPTRGAWAPR